MKIRKRKTYALRLTKLELLHIRDLFSVLLSTEAKQTVSQALASVEERSVVEARLWQKVAASCEEAKLPLADHAPDYICAAMVSPPPVGVFRVAHEPSEIEPIEATAKHPFGRDEED